MTNSTEPFAVPMNGEYLIANPRPGVSPVTPFHRGNFFDVYSHNITTRYGEVFWMRQPRLPLPPPFVAEFAGRVVVLTGYEVDTVRTMALSSRCRSLTRTTTTTAPPSSGRRPRSSTLARTVLHVLRGAACRTHGRGGRTRSAHERGKQRPQQPPQHLPQPPQRLPQRAHFPLRRSTSRRLHSLWMAMAASIARACTRPPRALACW